MVGYYIRLLRRDEVGSSAINQLCSGLYVDRDNCVREIMRRIDSGCLTRIFVDSDAQFAALEVGKVFFSVGTMRVMDIE